MSTPVLVSLIALPHLVQDDGRMLAEYVRIVKHHEPGADSVSAAVDQSCHYLMLLGVSTLAASRS